ncbi:sulfurtransferase [Bdellovibrio sp. HCB2-146]|uniref:sulfurtransferase n=1 Tax=Bdellovibrio sp. HCB2-146 TaxID=3394362 RepID=UPI0039BD5E97
MRYILVLLSVLLVISCQQKPTKVLSQETVQGGDQNTLDKFKKDNPAVLDVRSPFEFNLMHMPTAINVRWEDFSQTDAHVRGLLQNDLFAIARRLSLIGIDPDRKVLVVGKGLRGQGEEGRVAWTLKVLGVKNVMTLNHDHFREANPRESNPPVENKPYWKPQVDESLYVDVKEFKTLVTDSKSPVQVLDVRSKSEFQQENISKSKKVTAVITNMDWKSFFAGNGSARTDIESILQAKGISKDQIILIMSNHGVRSAAVTYALREAGFKNARNFAGGIEQWRTVK